MQPWSHYKPPLPSVLVQRFYEKWRTNMPSGRQKEFQEDVREVAFLVYKWSESMFGRGEHAMPIDVASIVGSGNMKPEAKRRVITLLRGMVQPDLFKRFVYSRWARDAGVEVETADIDAVAPALKV